MSLGENLQFLRKKNGITQEQLAEQLEVSRQSVSKWESDTTYPEMEKLLLLCQMFHVKMDDLVQKDVSLLYVEDKAHYDKHMNLFSKMMALGVGLILLGVSIMMFLEGINLGNSFNDELCMIVFFIFLIFAVAIFIVMGLQHDDFQAKNPHIENFYSEEEIDLFNKKYTVMIAAGVVLILIGIVLMIGLDSIIPALYDSASLSSSENTDAYDAIIGSVFLFIICISTVIFVYAGIQKDKYNIEEYNLTHDKESETYRTNELKRKVCGCLMLTATIIYLIFGFVFDGWGMPYVVVFPVFGIGCGIASIFINAKQRIS